MLFVMNVLCVLIRWCCALVGLMKRSPTYDFEDELLALRLKLKEKAHIPCASQPEKLPGGAF
jgi:hypothetical protein